MSVLKFLDTSPPIEEVELKIEQLKEDIRTLEHYRNARLLVVSRLPTEVLSLIFEYLALKRYVLPQHSYPRSSYANYLPVTQVCRLWRTVALNSPRMWGCIYTHTRKELAQLFLERARSAPLYLRSFGHYSYAKADPVLLLLQHGDQLKEIEIEECTTEWLRQITKLNPPLLEKLTLKLRSSDPVKTRFAPELEPGTTPPLRELFLTNCCFTLDVPFFYQLRTLKVNYPRSEGQASVKKEKLLPMEDVVLALQKMEHLETLELTNVISSPKDIPSDLSANLPNLTSLRITVVDINGLAILGRISCPSIQSLHAESTKKVAPDALLPIACAFYALLPPPSSLSWKTVLTVRPGSSANKAVMKIWPEASNEALPETAPFEISIVGPVDYQSSLVLCSTLPTTGPPALDVILVQSYYQRNQRYCDSINLNALRTFMRALEGVDELRVHHVEDIITLLADTPDDAKQSPAFSLPSLKHIIWDEMGPMQYQTRKLKQLNQALAARLAAGAGIETLTFKESSVRGIVEAVPFQEHVTTLRCKDRNGVVRTIERQAAGNAGEPEELEVLVISDSESD